MDFIATGRFKKILKNNLYKNRSYTKEKDVGGSNIFLKRTPYGQIYLDFLPEKDRFHGKEKILNTGEIEFKTESRTISYSYGSGFNVIVPEISMLLLLKLKAAWDRNYDLENSESIDNNYVKEKF